MVQPIFISRRLSKEFYILLIINLDKRDAITAVIALKRKGLVKAEEIFVKRASLVEITYVERNVSDTQNARSLDLRVLRK